MSILTLEENQELFETVEPIGLIDRPYSMFYEDKRAIFRCSDPKTPLKDLWPSAEQFI